MKIFSWISVFECVDDWFNFYFRTKKIIYFKHTMSMTSSFSRDRQIIKHHYSLTHHLSLAIIESTICGRMVQCPAVQSSASKVFHHNIFQLLTRDASKMNWNFVGLTEIVLFMNLFELVWIEIVFLFAWLWLCGFISTFGREAVGPAGPRGLRRRGARGLRSLGDVRGGAARQGPAQGKGAWHCTITTDIDNPQHSINSFLSNDSF